MSLFGRITAGLRAHFGVGYVAATLVVAVARTMPPRLRRSHAAPEPGCTAFALRRFSGPATIVTGPDGNLWFTEMLGNRIGRITPDGKITEFSHGLSRLSGPDRITVGPDGNLWFTELLGNRIGRITPEGEITEFSKGISRFAFPFGITVGPDGNLWFAESGRNTIGRITPEGEITEFLTGSRTLAMPTDIVAGPDGNLWYTERFGGVGRITTSGQVSTFRDHTFGAGSVDIAAGSDGALWFTETFANKIGRITMDGKIVEYSTGLSRGAMPVAITAGPDGNLWFTQFLGGRVGAITPNGEITERVELGLLTVPDGITLGPDGNLWFVEAVGSRVNRLDIGHSPTEPRDDSVTSSAAVVPGVHGDDSDGVSLGVQEAPIRFDGP